MKWMLLAQLLTSGGQLLYAALTARAFPPALFGAFTAALSLQGILTLMTTTGLPSFVLKQKLLSRRSAGRVRWMALAGGACASGLFLTLIFPWLHVLGATEGTIFIPLLLVSQLLAPIATTESSILRREGKSHVDALSLVGAFTVANGTGAFLIARTAEPWTLGLATAVYPAALFLLARVLNNTSLPVGEVSQGSVSEILSFSRKISAQNVIFYMLQQMPSWFTSARAGTESLGYFSRAATLAGMPAGAASTGINRALQPHWRKLGDAEQADRVIKEAGILTAALSFPLFGLLAANGKQVIYLWLGPNWTESADYVPLLAFSFGLAVPFVVLANSAEMRGLFRPLRRAQLAMAVGLCPPLLVLLLTGQALWAAGALALSQCCGLLTLIWQLPWHDKKQMLSTFVELGKQIAWAAVAGGTGLLVSQLVIARDFVLFESASGTQLVFATFAWALACLLTWRWNGARTILKARRASRRPDKALL
ncbi:lipopolysaccharide biosynthesis protein [Arthrobacter nitrophenolicus]|uniref:lipopolysaccharide biosynthesis protein n=1 Tax=Arthrobacter nitrophenolicus TaxID=683150 RepID=UPI00389A7254